MSRSERFDDAVVGAGVVGLAHAYHLARRGRKVIVFERNGRADGASVHNFGVLWPIGQSAGSARRMAMRSREVWLEVLGVSGLWHDRAGSLHLAYRDDEAAVLREFADRASAEGFRCEYLGAEDALGRSPAVRARDLIAGLYSHWEVCFDPREVIAGLPVWLSKERGVRFAFDCEVVGFAPRVRTAFGDWAADRLWVCAREGLRALYPDALDAMGLVPRRLRMLRTDPPAGGLRTGPILAGGQTIRHSRAFEGCPSLASLRERAEGEAPGRGLHVTAAQDGSGEITIGGSYEDGEPDGPEIDRLILDDVSRFLDVVPPITSRWQGSYAKHPGDPYCVVRPAPSVTAAAGIGGAGMTLSFGLAELVVNQVLGGD